MTLLDQFTHYGRFTGEKEEYLTDTNLDHFLKLYGQEWVNGYMKAVEAIVVEVSDILSPASDNVSGLPATPHMVRKNLLEYWSHNKLLLNCFLNQTKPSSKELKP